MTTVLTKSIIKPLLFLYFKPHEILIHTHTDRLSIPVHTQPTYNNNKQTIAIMYFL